MRWLSSIDRKLLRDLIHIRGQGLAVAIIVACGVAIMVMALGALSSLQASQDAYYDRFRFAHVFAQVKRAPESLKTRIQNIEGVRTAQTRITAFVTLDIEGLNEPANGRLISLPETGEPVLNQVTLNRGRWPERGRHDEIIVSKAFADAHYYEAGDHVTAILNGHAKALQIVGVGDSPEYIYTLGPGALLPDDKRFGVFWINRKALEAAFDLEGAFNDVSLMIDPDMQAESVIDDLDRILDPYGGIGGYSRDDQISHAFIKSEMQQLQSMARIIPPVFLIVSALLLNAILGRLIATERQQIGILKAFGYTSSEIGWHYIKLALVITFVGLIIGFALGAALARLVTHLYSDSFRFPILLYQLSPPAFLLSGLAAFGAAIIGALSAAMKAASLAPAEAMHPAPPESYRRGLIQQFSAKLKFDEPTRMILRHITRWPGRGATTVLGIAAAQGLLIGTLFSFDSLDSLLETFFYRTDPYEVSFSFVEPRGNEAVLDFARLPGVITVEPTRHAVIRLTNGQFEERALVIGLESGSTQKRVLDFDNQYTVLPKKGLTLSGQLAGMMAAQVGDIVTVEFLEGRRPILDITVSSIVSEYIGSTAYMDKAQLNRLLMESDVVTGGYAKIDATQMSGFQEAVLSRPVIASVALQSASIESFETTLEETISIMMSIYAIIGGAIAAGVVYNAARISLTERGRELASMRVLGFTQTEVSYILIGELVILTLIALPVGCLMGAGMAYAVATGMSTELFRVPLVIDPSTYGYSTLIVLLAMLLSSLLVIRRIRGLDMISVLKTKE